MNVFARIGHVFINFLQASGRLALFTMHAVSFCVRPPFYVRATVSQMIEIGFYSLPVVALTTLFSGMVIALQCYSGFSQLNAESAIAFVVVITIVRELGPVMAGLMVAGRVGAAMAAELGTMRVTEQIDALTTLSTNPYRYLVVPRLLGGVLMMPVLVLIGDVIGIMGGYLVSVYKLGFNMTNYLSNTWSYLTLSDMASSLTKAAVFGFIVTLLGCYNGFYSKGGAEGVGKATTNAVVASSVLIMIGDYLLTEMFFTNSGAGMETQYKIRMKDVCKSFGRKKVLDGVTLDVKKGESLVIIGGSGTGKSVTIKCIQGLLTPESGSIEIDGREIVGLGEKEMEKINAQTGMLFQGAALFDSLNIWENVAFGLIQGKKMSRREAKVIAIEKLRQVGLGEDVAELYPDELSGGMKKRVGLARAIAAAPELIFFDEPTTGLDPIMSDVINDLIRDCVKRLGATSVTITHDMSSVRKIADKVAMLYKGKIIWYGDVADIDSCGNPYVEQFINGRADGPIQMEVHG